MLVKIADFNAFVKKTILNGKKNFTEVVAPVCSNEDESILFIKRLEPNDNFILNRYRSVDPLKILLYQVREQVYPVNKITDKRIILGVKACDLKALQIMDNALINNGFVDEAYKQWREAAYIISSDCTDIHSSCNCILVDGTPYAENFYDLNLSTAGEFYYINVGSAKGEELLSLIKESCTFADSDHLSISQVQENRKKIVAKLTVQNQKYIERKSYQNLRAAPSEIWKEVSGECIGCGSCTNICPTCYCLILNDESSGKEFTKVRNYDSCQWNGYAKVAGGASPRPKLFQRFRNRYLCKFDFMKSNFGRAGCTGCGRCIEVCTDMREVLYKVRNYIKQENANIVENKYA